MTMKVGNIEMTSGSLKPRVYLAPYTINVSNMERKADSTCAWLLAPIGNSR